MIGALQAYASIISSLSMKTFVALLTYSIIIMRSDIVDKENRVQSVRTRKLLSKYDYVIIGGGSAGAVVASRLSEDKDRSVLLLEAGIDELIISDIPITTGKLNNMFFDWKFKTEPSSNYCLAMENQQCLWARGKVLGGSSVLNGMLYIRGNKRDYDSWAALGNDGWDFEYVLPYFKKSEDARHEELDGSSYHQKGGYLTVERFNYELPITDYILQSGAELGYKVHDVNGENQTGFTYAYGTLRNGLRCSTAKAFIRPASKRKNLHVSMQSFVEKILVKKNGTSKIAHGVVFHKGLRHFTVYAKREVILSAGAIQSPQLLMLSGIGPKDHLREMKIPVVHDAPGVGQNLQDHVGMTGIQYIIDPPDSNLKQNKISLQISEIITMENINKMLLNNSGPLYMTFLSAGMAFVHTKYANETIDSPDIQLLFSSLSDYGFYIINLYGIESSFSALYKNMTELQTFGILPLLLRPRSKGFIKLKSSRPDKAPIIVPNYFDDPYDLQVLTESMRFIDRFIRTPAMRKLNARPNPNQMPGCTQFDNSSNDYWACYARHFTSTIFHPVGTCKMGPANDSLAVVNARLQVHGIKGLRVIDASIMPNIISGNTNAPTIMIGEKGADMIKEDWL